MVAGVWDNAAHDGESWAGLMVAAADFLQQILQTDKRMWRADLYPFICSFIR
jgi:hypothetical protein